MIWDKLKPIAKRILPAPLRQSMRQAHVRVTEMPPYKLVRFGSFRRTTPIHSGFRQGRGTYIDRYYIERFLGQHSDCIRGHVLELAGNDYTFRFGGDRVSRSDVLDVRPGYEAATITADLTKADSIASDTFDCIILTQTLCFIYDIHAAVATVHRILKPGGCVLVSVPGIAQISPIEMEYCGDYWRFTELSLRRLLEESFAADSIHIESQGNVLAAVSLLHGLAAEELKSEELDYSDPDYPVSILLKAVK